MSNSVDPNETAHEPSHLDLRCLQKPIIIVCGMKVNTLKERKADILRNRLRF